MSKSKTKIGSIQMTSRKLYIMAQALELAIYTLKQVPDEHMMRENSNIADMEDLRRVFSDPFASFSVEQHEHNLLCAEFMPAFIEYRKSTKEPLDFDDWLKPRLVEDNHHA